MRIKDEQKQEAIIQATVKLVNEIGFVSSSVGKIANEAKVSPATIYIYYKNKEDLLVSTYVDIKKNLSEAMMIGFDESLPIRDLLQNVWRNAFDFISKNQEFFQFTEQFSNSPYSGLVNKSEINKFFEPLMKVLIRGIEQKIIKDVHMEMLTVFIFYPVIILSNSRLCETIEINDKNIDTAFNLAWDAIRL